MTMAANNDERWAAGWIEKEEAVRRDTKEERGVGLPGERRATQSLSIEIVRAACSISSQALR